MSEKSALQTEKYARALLRSRISSANKKLDGILNNKVPYCAIFNSNNKVSVSTEYSYFNNYNPYKMSLRSLNELFFSNPSIIKNNSVVTQAYTMFYGKSNEIHDILKKIHDLDRNHDLTPEIQDMLININNKIIEKRLSYDKLFFSGEKSMYEVMKLKNEQSKINVDDYSDILNGYNISADELNQTKLAINMINCSSKTTSFVDYLDIYSLYHYLKYREYINKRFEDLLKHVASPSLSLKCKILKDVVDEAFDSYCTNNPNENNERFDCSRMRLCEKKLDSEKAKKLTAEFNDMPEETKRAIIEYINNVAVTSPPKPIRKVEPTMDEIQEELHDLLDGAVVVSQTRRSGYYRKPKEPTKPSKDENSSTQLRIPDDYIM